MESLEVAVEITDRMAPASSLTGGISAEIQPTPMSTPQIEGLGSLASTLWKHQQRTVDEGSDSAAFCSPYTDSDHRLNTLDFLVFDVFWLKHRTTAASQCEFFCEGLLLNYFNFENTNLNELRDTKPTSPYFSLLLLLLLFLPPIVFPSARTRRIRASEADSSPITKPDPCSLPAHLQPKQRRANQKHWRSSSPQTFWGNNAANAKQESQTASLGHDAVLHATGRPSWVSKTTSFGQHRIAVPHNRQRWHSTSAHVTAGI